MRTVPKLIPLWLMVMMAAHGQNAPVAPPQSSDLVQRALAAELRSIQDSSHPMRYLLRKSSPRLTTTKELIETAQGSVAMLTAVNDHPPSPSDIKKDQARLDDLLADPGKQRHRKQAQDEDTRRALKVLRVLPVAYEYRYAGTVQAASGTAARFVFTPNPKFIPPDLETQVLTAMYGELWIDPEKERVLHLEARLHQDVDFGWGVLGRLYKGGWVNIDQAEIAEGVWRVVRFQMNMSARVLIRTRTFETTEEESHFSAVPPNLDYRQAIALLRERRNAGSPTGR